MDGQCHINDITVLGSSLLVSYFSRSGLWRKGIFDGGVSEIETDSKNINDLISNLSQPHSPEVIDGQIYILDSFNKYLLLGTKKISKFSGFFKLDNNMYSLDGDAIGIATQINNYESESYNMIAEINVRKEKIDLLQSKLNEEEKYLKEIELFILPLVKKYLPKLFKYYKKLFEYNLGLIKQ